MKDRPIRQGLDTFELSQVNAQFVHELERKRAEEALRKSNEELENRILARTAELAQKNAELMREINERKRAEAGLLRRNRELLSFQAAAIATASCLDRQFLLETVTWEMASMLSADGCAIYEWNQEADTISVIAEYGSADLGQQTSSVKAYDLADRPVRKQVLVERYAQQMTVSQPDLDPSEFRYMQRTDAKTQLILPMVFQDRVLGLVEMRDKRIGRAFTDHQISLAQMLATQVAVAIENAQLYQRAQQEIAERKRAEEQITASLKEKELLLKEIHHRVKNNLQVISSLLSLQSQSIESQSALEIFKESQNRIRTMALIHEKLYRSRDLARVDFADYIRNLATYLVRSYRAYSGPVSLKIDADGVSLGIDAAIPCGLIVNELVSNALKHAFPDGRAGEIRIGLYPDGGRQLTLVVADDGVGFPEGLDFQNTESLGMQLVNTLANQLDGTVELHDNGGTEFKITFIV